MTKERLDLVNRLRGIYAIPVNDGAGPLNGSDTFTREFPVAPIQKEAADEIERLRRELDDALGLLGDVRRLVYGNESGPLLRAALNDLFIKWQQS